LSRYIVTLKTSIESKIVDATSHQGFFALGNILVVNVFPLLYGLTQGALQLDVTTIPTHGVDATPIHASLSPVANGVVQGTAEITVQGAWLLHINVTGPQGKAMVEVPIRAVAPPPIS
jgi:hypothetical protein